MGNSFYLFDRYCDGQNGLHTHFARQRNVCDGVAWYERALRLLRTLYCEQWSQLNAVVYFIARQRGRLPPLSTRASQQGIFC